MQENENIAVPQQDNTSDSDGTQDQQTTDGEQTEKAKPKKKKRTAKDHALRFLLRVGITAFAAVILLVFVFGVYVDHSNSSYPMIKDGDLCITYKLGKPVQGDVVAYKRDGEIKFARVIASAGDEVDIKDDYVKVNGSGIFDDTVYATSAEGSKISYPYKVEDNSVFVLNDFRSDISDSRTYGAISLDDCKGTVIFVIRRRGI